MIFFVYKTTDQLLCSHTAQRGYVRVFVRLAPFFCLVSADPYLHKVFHLSDKYLTY